MANLYLGNKKFEIIYRCKDCNMLMMNHKDCTTHICAGIVKINLER